MVILFAILLFSILILLHELGHFVAAKLSGVKVNEFALFMGPAIAQWQWGETKYAIRCIPIGGYCALEGEDEETDSPDSFQKASWWKRLIILVAGSAMNFITGLVLFAIVFGSVAAVPTAIIDQSMDGCTIVSEDGLHLNDRIVEIDGEKIYVSSDVQMILMLNGGDVHDLVVERDGEKVVLDNFKMEKHLFTDEEGNQSELYGIQFRYEEATFGNRVKYVWNNTINVVRNVRLSLQMLLTGKAGLKDMSGPVGIVAMMSDTAQASETTGAAIRSMLYFGAFIAVNLAVMNMLPIPALDGGRVFGLLVITIIEAITKKKVDPKYEGYIHGIGMILLLVLMAVVLFKDVFSIFAG